MSRKDSVSTGSTNSSGSVDKETLDEYMDLVRDGREAFSSGKIKDAELFFSDALELELDTELDIVKKNRRIANSASVGSMSDLSIDSMKSAGTASMGSLSPADSPDYQSDNFSFHSLLRGTHMPSGNGLSQYKDIWRYLEAVLESEEANLRRNPKNPNAYLKKASALSLMNRWSEAKDVYREGIKNCKGSQKLNLALDAILKVEASTKRLADVSPRVVAESHSARSTPTPGHRHSYEAYLSPVMPRRNKFSMSSWSSLDNLEKVKLSPRPTKRMSPSSRSSPLRHSVDGLGSTDSLPKMSAVPLSSSMRADTLRFV